MRPPLADQLEDGRRELSVGFVEGIIERERPTLPWELEILDDGEDDFEEDSSGEVESDTIYFGTNGQTAILLSELLGGRGDLEDLEGEVEDDVKSDPLHGIKNAQNIERAVIFESFQHDAFDLR